MLRKVFCFLFPYPKAVGYLNDLHWRKLHVAMTRSTMHAWAVSIHFDEDLLVLPMRVSGAEQPYSSLAFLPSQYSFCLSVLLFAFQWQTKNNSRALVEIYGEPVEVDGQNKHWERDRNQNAVM
jgi:hypothetical protein